MKNILLFICLGFLIACKNTPKENEGSISKNQETKAQHETVSLGKSADYSSLFLNYSCDMTLEEVAQVLELPIADLEMEPALNSGSSCSVRYSPNGTYQTNLSWGMIPGATKASNKKAIAKELKDKARGGNPISDISPSQSGDCYLKYIPMSGRIQIYNEHQNGSFGLIYGNRSKRSEEAHQEMREKMTRLANYLLEKHRK